MSETVVSFSAAAAARHPSPGIRAEAVDAHPLWLAEARAKRDAAWELVMSARHLSERDTARVDTLRAEADALEQRILTTTARTRAGALAQAATVMIRISMTMDEPEECLSAVASIMTHLL